MVLALAVPLVPSVAYVTAGDPVKGEAGCGGVRSGVIPARGYLADPAGLEAGNFWWQAGYDGARICSGVVQMWLRYPHRENAEWLAGIYRGPVLVSVIADKDYVMDAGWHWRQFTIPAGAAGTVCVAVRLGHGQAAQLSRSCADPG
jgi:hypothetical protein